MSPTHLAQSARRTPSGAQAAGLRGLGFTFELLGTQEVGFGSVAWLRLGPTATGVRTLARSVREHEAGSAASPLERVRDGGAPRPPPQASGVHLPARALHIGETGQVPELEVENRGGTRSSYQLTWSCPAAGRRARSSARSSCPAAAWRGSPSSASRPGAGRLATIRRPARSR